MRVSAMKCYCEMISLSGGSVSRISGNEKIIFPVRKTPLNAAILHQ
jgi:hypothetical protein